MAKLGTVQAVDVPIYWLKTEKIIPWLIIECKTAGDEFEKAWAKTHQDGGPVV